MRRAPDGASIARRKVRDNRARFKIGFSAGRGAARHDVGGFAIS